MTSTHPYWLIFVAGIVALIPVIIGVATSYIKISVVLGMFRTGLGAQQVPSQLVIMALSLSMTLFIMAPVFEQSVDAAQGIDLAMIAEEPSVAKLSALKPLLTPWRDFMLTHVGEREYRVLEQMVLEMRVTAATQKQLSAQTASESLQELSLIHI